MLHLQKNVHAAMLGRKPDDPDGIGFKDVYPLRLIKQILSMFCSIANPNDPKMDDIRKFVLNKEAVGIDKTKYKLCLYFTNSTVMKHSGVMVVLRGNLSHPESMALAEITAYPLGFILYFNPTETWDYQGTDITECADYHYDDKCDVIFPWTIKEMNDIYPESFRSREEIRTCIEKNRNSIG